MFFIIPVGMNYRTERIPLVTFSLIGINTLIWIITFFCAVGTDGESDAWVYTHLWLVPSACTWYAPLTSMFVHAGPLHLIGNMIFLFLFGACVEDMIGRLRFAVFYLVGGLVAEMVYLAMSPAHFNSLIPMGGASGAISACMGMYLLLRAGVNIEFKYFIWLFLFYVRAGEFEVPAWVAILFYFGKDLFYASLGMIFSGVGEVGGGVAFGAHVGGFLGGLALLAMYKKFAPPREEEVPAETPSPSPIIDTSAILAAARMPAAATAATGETPTIFLHDGDRQTGPFTLTAVQAMMRNGEISRDMSYWSEGMSDWESVADLSDQPLD